jgi:hypothetical protein
MLSNLPYALQEAFQGRLMESEIAVNSFPEVSYALVSALKDQFPTGPTPVSWDERHVHQHAGTQLVIAFLEQVLAAQEEA